MQQFRSRWNRRYAATPNDGVFGLDEEADLKSANYLTNLILGRTLPKQDAEQLALLLHYVYGALAGAGYAAYAANSPLRRAGYGTLFGTALWILGDELPISISGLSDPFARSTRSHASAFAAHLLFGASTEGARRLVLRMSYKS